MEVNSHFVILSGPLAAHTTMMVSMMDYENGRSVMTSGKPPQIKFHMGGIVFGGDPGGELNDRILSSANLHSTTVSNLP